MHVVDRIHRGVPVNIIVGGGTAVFVDVGIGALRVPLALVPMVVRGHHVQEGFAGFLAAQFKCSPVFALPQVQGDGGYLRALRHGPDAARNSGGLGPGSGIAQVIPSFVVEEDALVHHTARGVAELQPRLGRVIDDRFAALGDEWTDIDGGQLTAPLSADLDFFLVSFRADGNRFPVPVAVPVFLGFHLVVVRLLRGVMLLAGARRDQVVFDAVVHHHLAGGGVLGRGHPQPVGVGLSLVQVHLLLALQALGPDAVQILHDRLGVFRLGHLVHRQVHIRLGVYKARLIGVRIQVRQGGHDVRRFPVRGSVIVFADHGVRLADAPLQGAQLHIVAALKGYIVHQVAGDVVDIHPGIRRVKAEGRPVADISL